MSGKLWSLKDTEEEYYDDSEEEEEHAEPDNVEVFQNWNKNSDCEEEIDLYQIETVIVETFWICNLCNERCDNSEEKKTN